LRAMLPPSLSWRVKHLRSGGPICAPLTCWLDQDFGGDSQFPMESPDHRQGQSATSPKHFVDTSSPSDDTDQGLWRYALLFQTELYGVDWIGQVNGEVFFFIGVYKG